MDKLARYFPKVGNSEYFSRKKLRQNKIGRFHLKHPVLYKKSQKLSLLIILEIYKQYSKT